MTDLLIAAITPVVSLAAVLATVYSVRHTNKVSLLLQEQRFQSEERSQHRNMLRAKGEELYMLVDTFKTDFGKSIADVLAALTTDGKYNAAGATNIRGSNSASLRIEMLTRVYFPRATPELEALKAHHGKMLAEMLNLVKCNTEAQCSKFTVGMMMLTSQLTEPTYELQKAVMRDLRALDGENAGEAT
jgi:hypothetical protein